MIGRAMAWLALVTGVLAGGDPAVAQSEQRRPGGSIGVGLVVGDPTGITAEYHRRSQGFGQAFELTVGVDSFQDEDDLYVHFIWKLYLLEVARTGTFDLPVYTGVGPWLSEHDRGPGDGDGDFDVGARIPFGIAMEFRTAPLQLFLELALDVELIDDVDIFIDGALGFRYFF